MVSVESVIDSQKQLVDRIQKTAGLPPEEFNDRFMPVIKNLARYVHLLPATRTGHHRGAGGLYRLALEMGLYNLQIANATIFLSKGEVSAETRYKLHPRWVYATFIAGVSSELYRAITNMVVTDEKGENWPQLLIPLHDWITTRKLSRYHVVWNVQDEADVIAMHRATAVYLLNVVAPMSGLQYLNEGNTEIVTALTTFATNTVPQGIKNQIVEITDTVRMKVIERDLKRNSERYGDFTVGAHLEPHLVDAMRKLIRKNNWEINVKGSRIWHSSEGMFIVWQPAAREIIAILKEECRPGIPSEADTIADILITCGIAESNEDDGRYWEICIPGSMQILSALKLQRIELLFNDVRDLEELDGVLLPRNLAKTTKAQQDSPVTASAEITNKIAGNPQKSVPLVIPATPESDSVEKQKADPATKNNAIESPLISENNGTETTQQNQVDASSVAESAPKQMKISEVTKHHRTETKDMSAMIFKSLPSDVADYLRAIVEDHQDGSSAGPVFSTPDGVAVSVLELESHGQSNFTGLVKALYDKSWLWTSPEKPMCKLYELKHDGKTIKCIVIRKDIAQTMGFIWKQTKKKKANQSDES